MCFYFFFSSRRRHTRCSRDWSSDVCSSDLVGDEGRGVSTIVEMVNHTRLDCVIGAAAVMPQALVQGGHHCRHRSAFGRLLIEQPLVGAVLADLAIESEAGTILLMRPARAYDRREPGAGFRS